MTAQTNQATPSPLTSTDVVTPDCRLSFQSLFKKKPDAPGSEKTSYQATFLFPPKTDFQPFLAAIKAACIKKFGKFPVPGLKIPIRPCEEKEYAGYDAGWKFLPTKSEAVVPVVDRQRIPVSEEQGLVYSGCWVKAHLRCYAWSHPTGGKGVSFELKAVQFIKNDERLDGRGKPSNPDLVFEALELEEGDFGIGSVPPGSDEGTADDLADLIG